MLRRISYLRGWRESEIDGMCFAHGRDGKYIQNFGRRTGTEEATGEAQVGINPLNLELNPICYLLALLAHHFLHVSRIMVKSLTLRLLMSYIYIHGAHILDVSRSHTTTQHSR